MDSSRLIEIGLSEKEAQAYIAVLKYGSHPISFLAKKAGLNRGTAYEAYHSLLERGLVFKSTIKKTQVFSPLNPGRLKSHIVHQEKEAQERKSIARSIVEELKAAEAKHNIRPGVEYFDGPDQVFLALSDTLNAKDKTLRSYLSVPDINNFIGTDRFLEYTQARIDSGYTLKTIRSKAQEEKIIQTNPEYLKTYGPSKRRRREVRYLQKNIIFPISMYIYDQKVLLLSSKDEYFALTVTSKEFAEMQLRIFQHLWERLEIAPYYD